MTVVLIPDFFNGINISHHQLSIGKRAIARVRFTFLGFSHGTLASQSEGDLPSFCSVLALVVAIRLAYVRKVEPVRSV